MVRIKNCGQVKMAKRKPIHLLSNTQEVLLGSESPFFRINIWIIFLVFVSASLWIFLGQIEDVVRVTGFIRPVETVSSINNIIEGEVISVSYSPGQYVKKDQLLLEIDSFTFQKNLEASTVAYNRAISQLEGNELLQQSLVSNQNLIPDNLAESKARFESFLAQKELLAAAVESSLRRLNIELELLPIASTQERVDELTEQSRLAELEFSKYIRDFEYSLEETQERLLSQIASLESDIISAQVAIKNCKIKAPVSGVVQVSTRVNIGDYLVRGIELLKIVPQDSEGLRGEFAILASQAGKVQEGMRIKIRVPSLPFHQYGGLESKVSTITPDVQIDDFGNASFVIYTNLRTNLLIDRKGREVKLKIGLQLDGRIVIKKQPIWQFILEKLNIDSW
jgi:multidrug resistance efflux pump